MDHIVLLGDAICDNAAYVETGQSLADRLRAQLTAGRIVLVLGEIPSFGAYTVVY